MLQKEKAEYHCLQIWYLQYLENSRKWLKNYYKIKTKQNKTVE